MQAASRKLVEDVADASFDSVNSDMKKDKERMWTSVDIQIACTEKESSQLLTGKLSFFPRLVLLIF